MEMYIIHLVGQGNIVIKLVDKETFEWVISSEMGSTGDSLGWLDKTCPLNVRKSIWENCDQREKERIGSFKDFYPRITYGSANNDRALCAPATNVDGERLIFQNISSYTNCIIKNKINIIDEYSGYIY